MPTPAPSGIHVDRAVPNPRNKQHMQSNKHSYNLVGYVGWWRRNEKELETEEEKRRKAKPNKKDSKT